MELVRDPAIDAVVVATPDHMAFCHGVEAMKAGKDVLLEKPVTHTWQEALELERIQGKTGRLLQVGTNLRSIRSSRSGGNLPRSRTVQDFSNDHSNPQSAKAPAPSRGPFRF